VAGARLMVVHLILLALAVVLFVYLGYAMFKPEAF
jgi:K+-transporting ATPase KdpF subunit